MDERQNQQSRFRWLSRAADFVFGGMLLLIGVYFFAIPLIKPGPGDLTTLAIGAVPFLFGIRLIFRRVPTRRTVGE